MATQRKGQTRVLVVGGCGFLGKHMAEQLLKRGYQGALCMHVPHD